MALSPKYAANFLCQLFICSKSLFSDRKTNAQYFPQHSDICSAKESSSALPHPAHTGAVCIFSLFIFIYPGSSQDLIAGSYCRISLEIIHNVSAGHPNDLHSPKHQQHSKAQHQEVLDFLDKLLFVFLMKN